MVQEPEKLRPTDLYGTWTVNDTWAANNVFEDINEEDKDAGVSAGQSKFRITHKLDGGKIKHVLEKVRDVRWNEPAVAIELDEIQNPQGKFLFQADGIDFAHTNSAGIHTEHKDFTLKLGSSDGGLSLVFLIGKAFSATGHTKTGTAGRP